MVDKDDWRLQGQEKYLQGARFVWRKWARPAHNPNWDHDHCSFCWKKFTASDSAGSQGEGYVTLDAHYWVCQECYDHFKDMFSWTIKDGHAQ